ncbi:MAG: PKD repeat protein, partial [Arenicella sp.]
PSSLTSTAEFDAAGTYTLTLTASDGAASVSDTVIVTVKPAMCGGEELGSNDVCILNCGTAGDVIFGDGTADATGERTAANCTNAASINDAHVARGSGSAIDVNRNCNSCH